MDYDKDILDRTGIFVFDNALSSQLCEDTIKLFYDNPKDQFKGKTGGGYNGAIKNTTDYYITEENFLKKYHSILTIATHEVLNYYGYLKGLYLDYCDLQFQKNEKGEGYFRYHSDNDDNDLEYIRYLAPIFYLNDVEEGGETSFKYQNIKIKPTRGRLIIFPCTWTFFHKGEIPISNNKYIITTFAITPRG